MNKPQRITSTYLVAVGFIYLCTSAAWLYLGHVTDSRTRSTDRRLRSSVGKLWGGQHAQSPPGILIQGAPAASAKKKPAPAPSAGGEQAPAPAPAAAPAVCLEAETLAPARTDARAWLDLEHRRKGLLWYSTYAVRFDGAFTFHNPAPCRREARVWLPLPASGAIYDELTLLMDGRELPLELEQQSSSSGAGALARVTLGPGATHRVRVRYSSRGMDRWDYVFGQGPARARDFKLVLRTNFDEVDFPGGSLSPSRKQRQGQGWELTWAFKNLVADASIAVGLPHRLNPGPLSAEISRFAPVSLFFFFFVLLLVTVLGQVRLHPVHFGMLAAAFFAFHLLMAYLVDLVPLWLAFGISAVTSVGLVVSYLRLVVGVRFALLWAGGAQLLYLVLFSLAFFMEGYTGLTITIFAVVTLFLVMQLTARINWSEKFGHEPPQSPALRSSAAPDRPAAAQAAVPAEAVQRRVG